MSSSSPELGFARTAPLRFLSRLPSSRTSTALRRRVSRAPPLTMPWPGMPHRPRPAPPLRHARQWPASRALWPMPRAPLGSHECGEHAGHLHRTEDLTVGELSPSVISSVLVRLTGEVPLNPEPVCQSLCVYTRVQIRVHPAFSSAGFQKDFKNDFKNVLNSL